MTGETPDWPTRSPVHKPPRRYGVVASIFGMNLTSGKEDSKSTFVAVNVACSVLMIFAFAASMIYIRYKRIL